MRTAPGPLASLIGVIGESDCEELVDGLLAQPVNASTSLSYVIVGLVIAVVTLRNGEQRAQSLVYATSLAAIGLGSVAFHGPQPDGSRVMHDLPILLTALFIVVHDVHLLVPLARRPLAAFAGVAAVAAAVIAIDTDVAATITGLAVGGVAVAELLIYRRRLRPIDGHQQRNAYLAIVVVAAVAGASWLLGRTDGPACDPGSVFQFHGLWHVISSLLFGLWWWLAFPHRSGSPHRDESTRSTPHLADAGSDRDAI